MTRFATRRGRHVYLLNRRLRIIDLDARANQPFRVRTNDGSRTTASSTTISSCGASCRRGAPRSAPRRTPRCSLRRSLADGPRPRSIDAKACGRFAVYDEPTARCSCAAIGSARSRSTCIATRPACISAPSPSASRRWSGARLTLNYDQLRRYLVNGYKALYKSGATFFEGVDRAAAGDAGCGSTPRGEETQRRVLDAARSRPTSACATAKRSPARAAHLERRCELRLRADVPLAFCLSGGVDSNALAAVAAAFGYDVHGFTIVDGSALRRADVAQPPSRALGIRHTELPVRHARVSRRSARAGADTTSPGRDDQLLRPLAADGAHRGEHGYRVSVSGTAADELFSGYYDHHLFYLRDVAGRRRACGEARRGLGAHVRPFVRNPLFSDPGSVRRRSRRSAITSTSTPTASRVSARAVAEPFAEQAYTRRAAAQPDAERAVRERCRSSCTRTISTRCITRSRTGRRFSIGRWPSSAPDSDPHLIRDGFAKAVLREAVRGIVPDGDRGQPRARSASTRSIHVVARHAMRGGARRRLLADSPIFDLVRRDAIEALLDRRELPNSQSKFLF